jgi:hypothetical protein
MRLSWESRELVKQQHMKVMQEVFRRSRAELANLRQAALHSGPARGAMDAKFTEMTSEIVDAKAVSYVAAFRRENLIPLDDEVREICADLSGVAHDIWFSQGHLPLPSSMDAYSVIVPRAQLNLNLMVKEMRIEARHATPAAPLSHGVQPLAQGAMPEPVNALSNDLDVLELKPNFFGVGLNLNHLIKRIAAWRKRRKK